MENKDTFKITLDRLTLIPLTKYKMLNWTIQEDIFADSLFFKLSINNYTYGQIYSLGVATFGWCFNWNRAIHEKINARLGMDVFGNKNPSIRFNGSSEELERLNAVDEHNLIRFPDNFFDDFLDNVRAINSTPGISLVLKDEIHFKIMLNYEDSVSTIDQDYNALFNTCFDVNDVYLDDTMFFAEIHASKISLLDIFCLGYVINYNDLKKRFETLKKNRLFDKSH